MSSILYHMEVLTDKNMHLIPVYLCFNVILFSFSSFVSYLSSSEPSMFSKNVRCLNLMRESADGKQLICLTDSFYTVCRSTSIHPFIVLSKLK